jgi:hypothetical protein
MVTGLEPGGNLLLGELLVFVRVDGLEQVRLSLQRQITDRHRDPHPPAYKHANIQTCNPTVVSFKLEMMPAVQSSVGGQPRFILPNAEGIAQPELPCGDCPAGTALR